MNLANKITLSRIILGPLFLISYLKENVHFSLFFLFLNLAGDLLDGFVARKRKETTEIGEFIDPFVDLLFFLFVALSFSFTGITQINWFFLPLVFIGLSFVLPSLKYRKVRIFHTKMKYIHTACIYILVLMILLEFDFKTFFWITFTVFTLISLEALLRSLRYFLNRESYIT